MKWRDAKWMVWCVLLLSLPIAAHAEIYKWRDKDGSIRYSDIPPPSNIKNEPMLGNKIPKPAASATAPVKDATTQNSSTQNTGAPATSDDAAAKRAKDAEAAKKAEDTKKAELKFRQESCAAAKRNQAMYNIGGRIATTDAQGERRFLSEDEIEKGKAEAAQAIEKFCVD